MGNIFGFFSGLAFVYLVILVPLLALLMAWLQQGLLGFISRKFMHFELTGSVFKACLAGVVVGFVGSSVVDAFGGGVLSLAVWLLATWPFLLLWTRKPAAEPGQEPQMVTHQQGAILSAASAFATQIGLVILGYLFYVGLALGGITLFAANA